MSRSIHRTRRDYYRELKNDYADPSNKKDNLRKIRKELNRKREIKAQWREEKQIDEAQKYLMPIKADAVQIHYRDENKLIHYPVREDDVRGIADYLPQGIFNGLDSIIFCLGKEYIEETKENEEDIERDPYTNRIGAEIIKGVHYGSILGTYYPGSCNIYIYAHVYEEKNLKPDVLYSYLRLQMMSTLIHELGHHDDYMRRMGRGRWMGLNKAKVEDYAFLMQSEWAESAIVPYLLDRYPDEYAKLSSWITEYGGVDFPLSSLAGESTGYEVDGMTMLAFTASSALEGLFQNINEGKDKREACIEFAEGLHYGDYYEECLRSLESILSKNANNDKALGIKADTLLHLEKTEEAEKVALKCLSINQLNSDALDVLCDIYEEKKDWEKLLEFAGKGIRIADTSRWLSFRFLRHSVLAALFTGRVSLAQEILDSHDDNCIKHGKNALYSLMAFVYKDYQEALSLSKVWLSEERIFYKCYAIFKAVYNAVQKLTNAQEKEATFSNIESEFLKYSHINELLMELEEKYG
jgi:tetratricopeptide (TPR) repeat protein